MRLEYFSSCNSVMKMKQRYLEGYLEGFLDDPVDGVADGQPQHPSVEVPVVE